MHVTSPLLLWEVVIIINTLHITHYLIEQTSLFHVIWTFNVSKDSDKVQI